MPQPRLPVAVLGASGFTGAELVRLLLAHPGAEITYLGARDSAGKRLGELFPHLGPAADAPIESLDPDAVAERARVAFCALPHGTSAELAPQLLEAGLRVVDLAGDFRLPAGAYPAWYGFEHPSPAWLEKSVFGLPELFGGKIPGAELAACPGCYPTPAILGLAPLVADGLIEPGPIHVDGKSGLSGAGKGPSASGMLAAAEESVRPYRFPLHQHTPEIEHGLELFTGRSSGVSFVPHLVPAVRGVLVTCYARLASEATTEELTQSLAATYGAAPFVRVLPPGAMADTKRTRGSNLVELHAAADPRTGAGIVVGALDNLVKGAAGQAVQCFNLMVGLEEAEGLPAVGLYP